MMERIASLENLFSAWGKFSKGKHKRADIMLFENNLEDNIFKLRNALLNCEYKHDNYKPFTVFDPKRRKIHKATVKDRLVHQGIVNIIEPIFNQRFIYDSYSCRLGKGTHAAVKRLRSFLNQASENNTKTVYALKCDVQKFFASVDHAILTNLLVKRIQDRSTIKLLTTVIDSFYAVRGRALPLGNLTSQLFANVYLHELDFYIRHELRLKYYLRYCDDFIILNNDRKKLEKLTPQISSFLTSRLKLNLHPNKVFIRSYAQGIDFLGYVLSPHATVIRTKTRNRILKKITKSNRASYLGLCKHANTHELTQLLKTKIV
ncbi:MAG: reverse transcriptase domain-containing protein [Patescibacteria group bacterium]